MRVLCVCMCAVCVDLRTVCGLQFCPSTHVGPWDRSQVVRHGWLYAWQQMPFLLSHLTGSLSDLIASFHSLYIT